MSIPHLLAALLLAIGLTCSLPAMAQDRFRGDGGGRFGDRGRDEDRGGRDGGGDRNSFFLRMIGGWDANHNGIIEPSEVPDRGRRFYERAAQDAGLDPAQPVSLDKLQGSMGSRNSSSNSGPGSSSPSSPSGSSAPSSGFGKSPSTPLVPGFGVEDKLPRPPGFDGLVGAKVASVDDRYEKFVIDAADETLRQYDKNGNRQLDQEEWKDVSWRSDPKESDTNSDGVLTRDELCERMAKRFGRGWKTAAASSAAGFSPSGGSASAVDREKLVSYAKHLMSRYDKNTNGVLEKDEVREMSGNWSGADQDKDDRLSLAEVTDQLAKAGGAGSSGGASDGSQSGSGGSDKGSRESKGSGLVVYGSKPFKVMTPADRLPKGTPSWFATKDRDGDGQIALAEYAPTMSDTTLAEFNKYDLNGDGFIIPSEATASDKKPNTTSTGASGSGERKEGERKEGERKEGERRGFGFGFGR